MSFERKRGQKLEKIKYLYRLYAVEFKISQYSKEGITQKIAALFIFTSFQKIIQLK